MRVLWLVDNISSYEPIGKKEKHLYNGAGWISSIQKALSNANEDIELGICFEYNNQPFKSIQNNVTYYPVPRSKTHKIKDLFYSIFFPEKIKTNDESLTNYSNKISIVLNDFRPDIIQVFGSENHWGLVYQITKIPIVIHIQGILNPVLNSFLPPGISWGTYIFKTHSIKSAIQNILTKKALERRASREKLIIKNINYYLGRTEWDKRIIKLLNPQAHYFTCNEILRNSFYSDSTRKIPNNLKIVSTISNPPYKGFDLILKTAEILTQICKTKFIWEVYGNIDSRVCRNLYNINHKINNIVLKGTADENTIKTAILNSTMYVNSSYIDNSPNAVCEAMILGVPVISTNVGGVPSLIKNDNTGYLVPSNDPFQLAHFILKLNNDIKRNKEMGENAKKEAKARHNKTEITNLLTDVYKQILELHKSN